MSPVALGTKNNCAGEAQQGLTLLTQSKELKIRSAQIKKFKAEEHAQCRFKILTAVAILPSASCSIFFKTFPGVG
jgi:hypothetical protein